MENIIKSVAYLRGLVEGAGYDDSTKEGRIFVAIAEVLDAMSEEMDMLSCQGRYCEDMIDELLDEECYDDCCDCDDDECCDDCEDDCCCCDCDDEDDFVEIECPHCHDIVYYDVETFETKEDLICPNCAKEIDD